MRSILDDHDFERKGGIPFGSLLESIQKTLDRGERSFVDWDDEGDFWLLSLLFHKTPSLGQEQLIIANPFD